MKSFLAKEKLNVLLLLALISAVLAPFFSLEADNSAVCESIEQIDQQCQSLSTSQCRSLLEECQSYFQEKSDQIESELKKAEEEKETLQAQIASLGSKIKSLEYQISQSNLVIKDLNYQIADTEQSVIQTTGKIQESAEKLVFTLRTIYEEDHKSMVEVFLSESNLSSFFNDLIALENLSAKNKELLQTIKELKEYLEKQKESLDQEKESLEHSIAIQNLQKQESQGVKAEREYLLKLTEAEYQNYLAEKESTALKTKEIMARIYNLIGVRRSVTYEEALEIAKYAAGQVGIRPALLLGVLSQESNIGQNVGQCYVTDPKTGAGIRVSSGAATAKVMNPTRDIPYFLEIIEDLNSTKGLGLDPYETLVSCPMSIGWGGAMGPAQFIPSTWSGAGYEARVEEIIGTAADPWDMRDASLASALYLNDGIDRYGTEGKAVQAYFCGSPTGSYWCKWYQDNVLYLASCHQSFIDSGSMSVNCQSLIF
jgi:peptidoglycan hydrolase CwlO-like protein